MLGRFAKDCSSDVKENPSSQVLWKPNLRWLPAVALASAVLTAMPLDVTAEETTPTQMIERGLPQGKTIKDASKGEMLFAICTACRTNLQSTPTIASVAVSAHADYAGEIVETVIRCTFPSPKVDCELLNSIVAATVGVSPDSAPDIANRASEIAPSCASTIKMTVNSMLAAITKKLALRPSPAPSSATASPSPSAAASVAQGSVAGAGALKPAKEGVQVCDNGSELMVPGDQVNDYLSDHPGTTLGPCPVVSIAKNAVTPSGKEIIPESGKQVIQPSGKEVLSESGKEVLPAFGKEVLPKYGNEPAVLSQPHSAFHISVSVREGYDDNVYTTRSDRVDSFFTKGGATLHYNFNNTDTQFDLQAVGGVAYYYDHPFGEEYNVNSSLSMRISHQATSRLILTGSAYLAYQSEPDFSNSLGIDRRVGNFFYTNDEFSVGYQWAPGFSTATKYTLRAIDYDDSVIGAIEDRFVHTFGNEFRLRILPTTVLVGEYRYQIVDFDQSPRDSTSHFVIGGLDQRFNRRFNVSLRGGAEFRDIDNFGERTSPYAEVNLTYAALDHASISWISRYGLEEPEVPTSPSRKTFRTGLDITCGILPRLASRFTASYRHDDNAGSSVPAIILPAFSEDSIDIGLEVRYEINRLFALLAGYSHTEVFSDIPLREYARNRYYLGLNASF